MYSDLLSLDRCHFLPLQSQIDMHDVERPGRGQLRPRGLNWPQTCSTLGRILYANSRDKPNLGTSLETTSKISHRSQSTILANCSSLCLLFPEDIRGRLANNCKTGESSIDFDRSKTPASLLSSCYLVGRGGTADRAAAAHLLVSS